MFSAGPAFAFAIDLGQIQSTSNPVAWTVGFVRDPSILYTAPNGATEQLRPYFVTKYGTDIGQAVSEQNLCHGRVLNRFPRSTTLRPVSRVRYREPFP